MEISRSLDPCTPGHPLICLYCCMIRKCSLKVIMFSCPRNADWLAQLTDSVGMDMHFFYPLHFLFAHGEILGRYGDKIIF